MSAAHLRRVGNLGVRVDPGQVDAVMGWTKGRDEQAEVWVLMRSGKDILVRRTPGKVTDADVAAVIDDLTAPIAPEPLAPGGVVRAGVPYIVGEEQQP